MNNSEIPQEVPIQEEVSTDLLQDGRVIYTISEAASVRFKPDFNITQFKNVDTNDISFIVQFRLIDPEEGDDEFVPATI